MTTIPDGWSPTTMVEVIELQRGFDLPHHARNPGSYPVLTSGDTGGTHDEGPISGPGFVVGRATNLGKPKWSDGDFWPHNTTMFAKDFKGNDPRWLFHLFEYVDLSGYDSGSVQPMLNRNYIAAVQVLRPPVVEQQAIAEVLGALDDKVAANTKLAATADDTYQALFAKFSRDAADRPRLADLVSTQYGLTASATNESSDVKFVRVTDINKVPWINWDSVPGVVADEPTLAKYRLHEGDVVVARMADPGKPAIIDRGHPEAVFASYLVRLRPMEPAMGNYLYGFLRSPEYLRYTDAASQGTVQRNINARMLVDVDIPMPSRESLIKFTDQALTYRALIGASVAENRILAATRDALLPQLMSGKIRVRDAEKLASEAGV